MNFIKFWKAVFCFSFAPLCFGGSESSTRAETTNVDQRLMQESGAVGATASGGGTAIINMIDPGAINAAFGMGNHAIDQVTDFATGALAGAHHTTEAALAGALHSVADTKNAYQDATNLVATAYEDAKIGNRSTMMMGAMALGAVALVLITKKA